jgi:uncharacterized protein DUF4404
MPRVRLNELLEQLQREIQGSGALDDEGRAALEALRDEIQQRLAMDGDDGLVDQPLMQRLDQAIGDFESRHPDFTIQLKQLVDAFRALGFR